MQWVPGRAHRTLLMLDKLCCCTTLQPFPFSYPSWRPPLLSIPHLQWASDSHLSDCPELLSSLSFLSELAQCHWPLLSCPPFTEHRRPSLSLDFPCLVECKIEFSYSIFMVSSVTVISFINLLNVVWCYMPVITALRDWSRKTNCEAMPQEWW